MRAANTIPKTLSREHEPEVDIEEVVLARTRWDSSRVTAQRLRIHLAGLSANRTVPERDLAPNGHLGSNGSRALASAEKAVVGSCERSVRCLTF
jgi:hypothetical protein